MVLGEAFVGGDQVNCAQNVGPVKVVVMCLIVVLFEPAVVEGVVGIALRFAAPLVQAVEVGVERTAGFVPDVATVVVAVLSGDQVVLATPPDKLAVLFERSEQHRLAGTQHVIHSAVATDVRVPTGHKRASAGRAHWVLAEGVPERHTIGLHHPVQVGCHRCRVAHVPQHVTPPLIGVKDHDVWALGHECPFYSMGNIGDYNLTLGIRQNSF